MFSHIFGSDDVDLGRIYRNISTSKGYSDLEECIFFKSTHAFMYYIDLVEELHNENEVDFAICIRVHVLV